MKGAVDLAAPGARWTTHGSGGGAAAGALLTMLDGSDNRSSESVGQMLGAAVDVPPVRPLHLRRCDHHPQHVGARAHLPVRGGVAPLGRGGGDRPGDD